MCLLKQDALFIWDEQDQRSFNAVKPALMSTAVLNPSNYTVYFMLYLAATESMLGIVFIQGDESSWENVMYYLSKGLDGPEFRYS